MLWFSAFDDRCHNFGRDGAQENAVAEMASGDVVAGCLGLTEDRESVGSSGAQAGPVFEDSSVAQFRDEREGCVMQTLDGGEVGALVESGFFDGGADEETSVTARDEIDLGGANDVLEQSA